MGALQVEVKILKKVPLLFAWENKQNNQVESYLITCQCQQLGLQGATGDDDKNGSSIFHGGNEAWATKLAHALEISEVVSFSSLEPCVTVGYGIEHSDGIEEADGNKRRKKKKKKKSSRKKKELQDSENGLCEKDVALHDVEGRHVDSNEVVDIKQTVVTTEAEEEQTQSESQKSMQEELPLSAECSEGQTDLEESNRNNKNSTVDVTKDSDSNEEVTNSKPVGADMNNASKESLDCTFSDSNYDNEESNVHDVLVHTEDGSISRKDKFSNGSLYRRQIIPTVLQLSVTHGAASAINKDQITFAQVTSPSNMSLPVSEEEAMMNAISSMMDIYPGAVIDVPQAEQYQIKPAEATNEQKNQKRHKPDFIRTLTEEERKNMFKFHSDIFQENLKKLQEGGKCFLCEHCGRVVSSSRQKLHLETHSIRPRDVSCDQCGKKFFDKRGLDRHMMSHSSERKFKCRYCPRVYKSFFGRTKHERAHFNIYAGVCSQCGRKFPDTNKYKAHIARDCTARLKSGYKQRKHGKHSTIHEDDPTRSTCNICGKILRTGSMPAHLVMHSERMYTCPICNKSMKFATKYVHMKTHNEERKYVCEVCNKSFKTNGVLTTHMMTHTGERPLKCRYCEKTFSRHGSRTVHETIHTGERPFPCTICNKGWKDRPTYMAHMKKHHPGAPLFYKRKSDVMNQRMTLQEQTEKQDNLKPKEPS